MVKRGHMSNNVILIGAGGHAKSLIEVIEDQGIYKIEGLLDDNLPLGLMVSDYPVIGALRDIDEYKTRQRGFIIAIGNLAIREKIFASLVLWRQNIPNIVSPKAIVSYRSRLGIGSQIMAGAYIGPDVKIGKNSIINTKAIIEHDCEIGDNTHICPGVTVIGGQVVYDRIMVGAGAVVTKHLKEPGTYIGVPARKYDIR